MLAQSAMSIGIDVMKILFLSIALGALRADCFLAPMSRSPILASTKYYERFTKNAQLSQSSNSQKLHFNPKAHAYGLPPFLLMTLNNEDEPEKNSKPSNNKKKKKWYPKHNSTSYQLMNKTDLETRISQLEEIVSRQELQIQKLRKDCNSLLEAAEAFAKVIKLLRQAGNNSEDNVDISAFASTSNGSNTTSNDDSGIQEKTRYDYVDDSEIFGRAPSSVIDAADAAGAAILAGMLGGKQRMLVDVRDAELSRDSEILVQFIELAILPVAAGLEGLRTTRNRVKIVFPTVSQLLQYRRTMALAAPEVVALSTLGFDPVEKHDQLVVVLAPAPGDKEGLAAMNELLCPTTNLTKPINQPLVVINHHMAPVSGPAKDFEVAYHLRLLSVQYMRGENRSEYLEAYERHKRVLQEEAGEDGAELDSDAEDDDEALKAAMKHAHEIGLNHGVTTRAMVIRAYPK
jgi:hypothetical protein